MFEIKPAQGTVALTLLLIANASNAYNVVTDGNWQVDWDNTFTYNYGSRVQQLNPLISNNPNFDESDNRFSNRGDAVTNRVSILTEMNIIYQKQFGARISASAWNDFAYDGSSRTASGNYAPAGGGLPAVPYSAIGAYPGNAYSSYTKKYYNQGIQLLDAFVFSNFSVGDVPVYLKAGKLTQYWGNSLFFGFQGISYSQGALDGIKGAASPGTQLKELFIPRKQISLTIQPVPDVEIGLQYALGFDANRLPEGGTYLGPADFLFNGPRNFFLGAVPSQLVGLPAGGFVPLNVPYGGANQPSGSNGNYGVKAQWSPTWLSGSVGAYYRKFDETQPWAPLFNFGAAGPTDYHLAFNRGVQLFGLSLEKTIGDVSSGFEASYRRGTALNSTPNVAVPQETSGAKGNTLNLIANAIVPLGKTALYNSGTLIAEMAYTRLLSVDSNAALYNGENYAGCAVGQNKWDGCSTRNALALAVSFTPQWQQVFPGVDLEMPISDTYGVYGNAANLGGGAAQGSHNYSIGLNAIVRGSYTIKLAYNGSYAHTKNIATTPAGLPYYASGNGAYGLNDRGWLSLTLQAGF